MKPMRRVSVLLLSLSVLAAVQSAEIVKDLDLPSLLPKSTPISSEPPRGPLGIAAGGFLMTVENDEDGIRLTSLFDQGANQELLATNSVPLFTITLRETETKKEIQVTADQGWKETNLVMEQSESGSALILRWVQLSDPRLSSIAVTAKIRPAPAQQAFHCSFRIENGSTNWSVWRAVFPQIALADLGEDGTVLFPRGPGEIQRNVWARDFHYRGDYPGGWCAMQFVAAYRDADNRTGLYLGLHDPWGSTKNIELKSEAKTRRVLMSFDSPAADMGKAGNDFELSGEAVWQLLRGDWFDAAVIYRDWVRKEARWMPDLGAKGRSDTPLWMRELSLWAQTGGSPEHCSSLVQKFQTTLQLPVGFHWYSWHQIPFDNDYPHYFPAKTNFRNAVAEMQQSQVFVMPYINGRLWDTKDRGAEDGEFSKIALAAATKGPDGKPYLESYGSKETNGEPVRLAAMCPTTPLWQGRVKEIVLRLLKEEGTRGVYIDQVAAAAPTLCMDSTHGHPLGGGHWWNEGYWKMLEAIRAAMPKEAMLTTECNGEPFIRWFDGYLTWHWQHDGQVPVFPAVYGGTLQMFGRAYRGGATKKLAFRMKAGQQLVYGEQIGWFDPGLASETENLDFLRKVLLVREKFKEFFFAGEMARPPKLIGTIPQVKADWQWSGEWNVTTDAVLTGAWRLPKKNRGLPNRDRLVLLFANVSDEPVLGKVSIDRKGYGMPEEGVAIKVVGEGGAGMGNESVTFGPRSIAAWELSW